MNKNRTLLIWVSLALVLMVMTTACQKLPTVPPESTDPVVTTPGVTEPGETDAPAPQEKEPLYIAKAEAVVFDEATVAAYIASHTEIDVLACGADNTGKKDNTALLQYIHNAGKTVYYPNGTYLFNGATLNMDGGVRFASKDGVLIRNEISDTSIVNFDDFGNLIGLMQNHLEIKEGGTDSVNGTLAEAPLSTASYDTALDILPYFYTDFGLTRTLTGEYGWDGYYYWSWNHHEPSREILEPTDYDPSLHPLLGFYYGDDPTVLDWQCYWLREYGMNQVILLATPDVETWASPTDENHWVYQLFTNVKNFREMKYVLNVPYGARRIADMEADMKEFIDFYRDHPSYYTIELDGKTYAVMMNYDDSQIFGTSATPTEITNMFVRVMEYAREQLGTDGIFMLTRSMTNRLTSAQNDKLEAAGLIRFRCAYDTYHMPDNGRLDNPNYGYETYEGYITGFSQDDFNTTPAIGCVSTSLSSISIHPSKYLVTGSTPELFGEWLTTVRDAVLGSENPKLLVVNGVSEWAEYGPGLTPNVRDGFGYLNEIADALGITPGQN